MDDDKLEIEKYKLYLANDLIVYLTSVLSYNMSKEQASLFLGKIFETWTTRIDSQYDELHKQGVDMFKSHNEDDSDDVADVIVEVHAIFPKMLRDEFIEETLSTVQKIVIESKKD